MTNSQFQTLTLIVAVLSIAASWLGIYIAAKTAFERYSKEKLWDRKSKAYDQILNDMYKQKDSTMRISKALKASNEALESSMEVAKRGEEIEKRMKEIGKRMEKTAKVIENAEKAKQTTLYLKGLATLSDEDSLTLDKDLLEAENGLLLLEEYYLSSSSATEAATEALTSFKQAFSANLMHISIGRFYVSDNAIKLLDRLVKISKPVFPEPVESLPDFLKAKGNEIQELIDEFIEVGRKDLQNK